MKQISLQNIIISFERPKESKTKGYAFVKNPPKTEGGGLLDQVIMVKEEFSFSDLVEDFLEISDGLSDILGEEYSYLIATILSYSLNKPLSINVFPDEYKEILDLVKETKNNYNLNQEKLSQLIEKDSNIIRILDALIEEGFLGKKRSGDYVVRKKILSNIHVSFLQISES